jgi:hypothetical protein
VFRIKRRRWPDSLALKRFFQPRDALLRDQLGAQAEDVLAGLSRTRVQAMLTRLSADDPADPPPLEPMLPAPAETVLSWSGDDRRQVLVTRDEQSAFTAGRLRRPQQVLADGAGSSPPAGAGETGSAPAGISPLAGLLMLDSRDDPRVRPPTSSPEWPGGCRRSSTTAAPAVRLPNLTMRSPAAAHGRRDRPRSDVTGPV